MSDPTDNSAQGHLTLTVTPICHRRIAMKPCSRLVSCLFALVVVAGCASTKVTNQQRIATGEIPRPAHILVYDFAATPGDVPADAAVAGQYAAHSTPQTAEQIATGRQLGAAIAAQLVEEIRSMGLPAERASRQTPLQLNDIMIRGYLLSIDEGSAVKRVAIGFGAGASELKTMVEGYQVTERGLRKLGSGTLDAGASKTPGAAVPLAVALASGNPVGLIVSSGMKVYGEASGNSKIEGRAEQTAKEIAAQLKTRFAEQGWIQ
jgi:hypothetical protein